MRLAKLSPFGVLLCPSCEGGVREIDETLALCGSCPEVLGVDKPTQQKVRYYRELFIRLLMKGCKDEKMTETNQPTSAPSILSPEMCGLMYITGLRGVGKSYFAAQADRPSNICFLDFEEKGRAIHNQLGFGSYTCITTTAAEKFGASFKPVQLFEVVQHTLSRLEKDRFTVAILDNIEPLESSFLAHAQQNAAAFGLDPKNALTGAKGGAWPAVNNLVSGHLDLLHSKGIKLVIAIAHVKPDWGQVSINGNLTFAPLEGKYKPKGVDRWQERSILSLVLIPGTSPPTPSAIVLKEQLGKIEFNEETGEFSASRRLPMRLPKATLRAVQNYLNNPADLENPAEGEKPTEEEMEPYIGRKFKDSQIMLLAEQPKE